MATSGKKSGILTRIVKAVESLVPHSTASQKGTKAKAKKASPAKAVAKEKSASSNAKASAKPSIVLSKDNSDSHSVVPTNGAAEMAPGHSPGHRRMNVLGDQDRKGPKTKPQNASALNRMSRADRIQRTNQSRRLNP